MEIRNITTGLILAAFATVVLVATLQDNDSSHNSGAAATQMDYLPWAGLVGWVGNAQPSAAATQMDYRPTSVASAFGNHFGAFATRNVTQILLDYTEESELVSYDWNSNVKTIATGTAAIGDYFSTLFSCGWDPNAVGPYPTQSYPIQPLVTGTSAADGQTVGVANQVFLQWHATGCGIPRGIDTFIFDNDFKIIRHNIAVGSLPNTKAAELPFPESFNTAATTEMPATPRPNDAYSPTSVASAFSNHFGAFAARDVEKIKLDYTEHSELVSYDWRTNLQTTATGREAIGKYFTELFSCDWNPDEVGPYPSDKYPIQPQVTGRKKAEGQRAGTANQVFLMWQAKKCGIPYGVDTFIFNDDYKIVRHNIAVESLPYTNAAKLSFPKSYN